MAKIFELNFNEGSILEYAGTVLTRTGTASMKKTQKGWAFPGSNSDYFTLPATNPTNSLTVGTIECWVKFNGGGASYEMVITDGASGLEVTRNIGTNGITVYIANSGLSSTSTVVLGRWYHIVCTWNVSANTRTLYINGVAEATGTIAAGTTAVARTIGSRAGFFGLNGEIGKIMLDNTAFTSSQVVGLYANFVAAQPLGDSKRGFLVNKPNDLSKEVNNTLGSELGTAFNTWNKSGTIVDVGSGVSLAPAAVNYIYKTIGTAGRRYLFMITASSTVAGDTIRIYHGSTTAATALTLTTTPTTYFATVYDPASASNTMYLQGTAGTGTVTVYMVTIKEYSGLVAAYNMRPIGNKVVDISGNGKDITLVGQYISTKDGTKITNNTNGYGTATMYQLGTQNFSVAFRARYQVGASNILFRMGGGYNTSDVGVSITTAGIQFSSSSRIYINGSGGVPSTNEWNNYTLVCNRSGNLQLYVNGVSVYSLDISSYASESIANNTTLYFGFNGAQGSIIEFEDFRWYNRALSLQEVKDYHNSFAKQPYLVEDFSDLPCDGNTVVPREWTKISGTFKGGEISLAQGSLIPNGYFESGITGYGLTAGTGGNATLSYETASPITGVGSLRVTQTTQPSEAFRPHITIALTKTTEIDKTYSVRFKSRLLSGAVKFSAGNGVQLGLASSQAYLVNQVFSGTQQWSVTVKSTAVGTNMFLYFNGSLSAFDLLLDDIEVVEIDPLPTLTKGSKYLECVTAGIIAIPSNQLAGTWEWDWYKGADANTSKFHFVAPNFAGDGSSSMTFYVDNSENLLLRVSNSTIASTATSYFRNFTWYRVRVTRTTAGSWTMLIKGGAFTPTAGYDGWTLISTTGGTGTNPIINTVISSSIYLLFDIDAGDRFTNLKLTNGVII